MKAVITVPLTAVERSGVLDFSCEGRLALQRSIDQTDPIPVRLSVVPGLTVTDALDGLAGRPVLLDPAG